MVGRGALAGLLALLAAAPPAGALAFATNPDVPNLGTLTLSGQAQTLHATMNNFAVSLAVTDTAGFNVTVNGDSSTGHSAVFKQYCPNATCGTDSLGYISGGQTLPAGSLTLNSTGASFTETSGVGGSTPTLQCNSGCTMDSASPVKVASQTAGIGVLATWTASGWSSSSVSLAVPTTIRVLTQAGEVYRLDLTWSLTSGP
jgi:hypothetical protein